MICRRCGQETIVIIMSRFNTEEICMDCEELERSHPRYQEAVAAEEAAVKRGEYNFPGIGKPADLGSPRKCGEVCDKCGRPYTAEDIDGGRCLGCGTMIAAEWPDAKEAGAK